MRLIKFSLKRIFLIYIVLEIITFIGVCELIGALLAILLMILTSALGFSQLRQKSHNIIRKMQRAQTDPVFAQAELANIDGLHSIACILLILPGFLTDIAGGILLIPKIRGAILKRFSQPSSYRNPKGPQTFEGEYKRQADNDEFIDRKDDTDHER